MEEVAEEDSSVVGVAEAQLLHQDHHLELHQDNLHHQDKHHQDSNNKQEECLVEAEVLDQHWWQEWHLVLVRKLLIKLLEEWWEVEEVDMEEVEVKDKDNLKHNNNKLQVKEVMLNHQNNMLKIRMVPKMPKNRFKNLHVWAWTKTS